ncbi:MAG: L,D-transpeptidase [Patescibacteria group bacterium]
MKKSSQKKNSFITLLSSFLILSLATILISQSYTKNLSGEYESAKEGNFLGKIVSVPPEIKDNNKAVLAEYTGNGNKHIYIDLSKQTLYAYEDDHLVYTFLISSGKWYPTPTGDFNIWIKVKYTKMSGGNPNTNTYYYLPNVPYVMYFSNDQIAQSRGFGLHGTYWHENFGHPMSHGCVNMRTADAETLYYWTNPKVLAKNTTYASKDDPGTPITIYGEAPKE